MTKRIAITGVALLLCTGCMSEEEAANEEFNEVLEELALGQGRTKADIFGIGEKVGKWMLCTVLRKAIGNNPSAQSLMLVSGSYWEGEVGPLAGEVGGEIAYDLANYQVGTFSTWGAGASLGLTAVGVRRGSYKGVMWGHHTSVLDLAGLRTSVDVHWMPPIVSKFLGVGVRLMSKPNLDSMLYGAAVSAEAGFSLKLGAGDLVGLDLTAKGGQMSPNNEKAAEMARDHADLGAVLNTNCPSGNFVQYEGAAEDDDDGYHKRRGKAMAEAILRNHKFLGISGIGAALVAKVAAGLGVARDHGGFGAICGGDLEASLDESPVPEPRCPTLPTVNPHEPEEVEDEPTATDPTATDPEDTMADPEDATTTPTPSAECHKYEKFDLRYCSVDCPCKEGEGDCDNDDECEGNLKCVRDAGAEYGASSTTDICKGDGTATTEPEQQTSPEQQVDPEQHTGQTGQTGQAVASFTSPQDGAVVDGAVQVKLAVQDEAKVKTVTLIADGAMVQQWFAPPFEATLTLEAGSHALTATVVDNDGNLTEIGPIGIEVRASAAGDITTAPTGAPDDTTGGVTDQTSGVVDDPYAGFEDFAPPADTGGCSLPGGSAPAPSSLLLTLLLLARRRRSCR